MSKHANAEIARNAATLLLSGYQPDAVAGILQIAAEGNDAVTPAEDGKFTADITRFARTRGAARRA